MIQRTGTTLYSLEHKQRTAQELRLIAKNAMRLLDLQEQNSMNLFKMETLK